MILDDVAADTADAIEVEFEAVTLFFADRLGAKPPQLTMYVAARVDSVREVVPGWRDSLRCQEHAAGGLVVLTLQRCGDPPPLDAPYVDALLADLERALPGETAWPPWLPDGVSAYALVAYRSAAGRLALDDYRRLQVQGARRADTTLRDLGTNSGYYAMDDAWAQRALSFLAAEWLANHAGDAALFDYYRRLADAASPAAAFEAAFGRTIEEFYEQFEAYRATLEAP